MDYDWEIKRTLKKSSFCCQRWVKEKEQDLDYTVVGRANGTSDIIGMSIIITTEVNSILTVRNPAGNLTALTITPLASGTKPVSAHLVIMQIQ